MDVMVDIDLGGGVVSMCPRALRFKDAEKGQCLHFITTETGADALVCGEPTLPGKSYCGCHYRRVYRPNAVLPSKPQIAGRLTDADLEDDTSDHEPDLTEVFA